MVSLGIDIGGTGCKCVAFNEEGEQLALAYLEYPLAPGTVDLPPEVMMESVMDVIRRCVEGLERPSDVRCITVSSFGESFIAVGEDGRPVCESMPTYLADTSNREFFSLVDAFGKERMMRICRLMPDAYYSLSKILHTQKTAPAPVGKYLFVASYVCFRLCGACVTDPSLACRGLLYDVEKGCWSEEILEAAGIMPSQLPEIVPTGTVAGSLLPEVASRLNLGADVQVLIGAHDQIVNALGSGIARLGQAVDNSGTVECITPLFAALPENMLFHEENYCCSPYLDKGYVTFAYNISAGTSVRWFRDAFGMGYDELNRLCPGEPTDLMVLPFLQGMGGTPDMDQSATGTILGLNTSTRRPDLYRALLEGITFEMRYNQEKIGGHGIRFDSLFACGGGARSDAWMQIKADILGCRMVRVDTKETGALGSAILGISAMTGESPFSLAQKCVRYGEVFTPDPLRARIYDERYDLYKQLRNLHKGIRIKR